MHRSPSQVSGEHPAMRKKAYFSPTSAIMACSQRRRSVSRSSGFASLGTKYGSPTRRVTSAKGFGIMKRSQLLSRHAREQSQEIGRTARPVSWARNTNPPLISYSGPREPSGVMATSCPRLSQPASSRSAAAPRRVAEPRTGPMPKRQRNCAMSSPCRVVGTGQRTGSRSRVRARAGCARTPG